MFDWLPEKNANLGIGMMGLGQGLMGMSRGQSVNLAPYAAMIQQNRAKDAQDEAYRKAGEAIFGRGGAPIDNPALAAAKAVYDADPRMGLEMYANSVAPEKLPAGLREYEYAKAQGFGGSFMDYQTALKRAGASSVSVNANVIPKWVPEGYLPNDPADPTKGVQPIAGGPKEQISGEVAGRIAGAKASLQDIDAATETLVNMGVTDAPLFYADAGDVGRAKRSIREAIGAALYLKTGAAATQGEVDEQLGLYMPAPTDSPETRAQKARGLKRYLETAQEIATRGRGGSDQADPLGLR